MMGYYRKFVKDYAKIAQPLNNLLKKDTKFNWTEDCEQAFNVLKAKLIEAPILRYPKFDAESVLSVDSLDYSIGYMPTQEHDGKQHPICFGGRAPRENELKWHITDKEGLALVEGIQQFKHYLANSKFTVFTDNVMEKNPRHDKQHKFFTQSLANVNTVQTDNSNVDTVQVNQNKTRLLGMRLINGKPYYLIQKGTTTPEWQTVAVAHWYARDLLEFLIEDRNKEDEQGMMNGIRMKKQGFVPKRQELDDPHWEQTNEIQINEDGSYHCLVVYRNPELAPEWVLLEETALGNKYDLIKILK